MSNAAEAPKPAAPRKLFSRQREVNADKHPAVKLVPDKASEQHAKSGQGSCGARRTVNGLVVECGLPILHGGNHSNGGRSWRPRSGD